jgi:WD40 repeat protein
MCDNRPLFLSALVLVLAGAVATADDADLPPGNKDPVLRIDPGGPGAFVTSLAFSPDGKTLYSAGWDKVIRVWTRNETGDFERSRTIYRVPVGPALGGVIDAMALSPDGHWLAAGGSGMARHIAGFREQGFIVPDSGVRDRVMLLDIGSIYLFSTRDRTVRMLRGHLGPVSALTFAPQPGEAGPRLLSVAREKKDGDTAGTQLTARLWDFDKGVTLAELRGLPTEELKLLRPGVALWPSGEKGDELRAVFALHDGKLRVWNASHRQQQPEQVEDLLRNLSVTHLDRNQLLTTGFDRKNGKWRLGLWGISAEGKPEPRRQDPIGDGYIFALTILSRKRDASPDLAAVVVLTTGTAEKPYEYRLRLIDLTGETFRVVADQRLWQDRDPHQPVMAADPRGEYLAVAGNQDHTIQVHSIRALLNAEKPAPKKLAGEALSFRHVSFVRRGKDLGLLLNRDLRKERGGVPPQPDATRGDWIFDFSKRRLSDDLAGWEAAHPKAGSWSAREDKGAAITAHESNKPVRKITLRDREKLTDYALLPPGESVKVPLLAVATHLGGQPRLALYNAESGEQLRQFTGHKERVGSLAFAPDGRLLVSTAEDGTVCVWSLTDLDTVLGQRGQLSGLIVGPAEGAVKVLWVEANSPAHGKLNKGDRIIGLVEKEEPRPLKSPADFYEALFRLKPGSKVILRRGDPGGKDDVSLVVGQGIDERKPLFSLFVSRAEKAADCEWIGWSPFAPYESSSPKAEKYLGWQFNTGDAQVPVRFAGANQYRKLYYRVGILEELIKEGAFKLGAIPLPRPAISLCVEESGLPLRAEGGAPCLARHPLVDFNVVLDERPLSSLSALTWQLDRGKETSLLDHHDGDTLTVPNIRLSRGEHRFVVTARARDLPEPVHKTLTVVYQPSPPKVVLKDADKQLPVDSADFTFAAEIEPNVTGEDVRVTLVHRRDGEKVEEYTRRFPGREVSEGVALRFEHRLKLQPGENVVEVAAVNGGALGDGQKETAPLTRSVFYFKAKPPEITFEQVNASGPVVIETPDVELRGEIKADKEPLIEAAWDRGKDTRTIRLGSFEPGERGRIRFREWIALQPGVQTIRFRAQTKNSDEAQRSLTLEYRPPVPVVSVTEPRAAQVFDGEEEKRAIRVRGKLVLPPKQARQKYEALLLVNGKRAAPLRDIDEKTGTWSGEVVLGLGESVLQVLMSNQWGSVEYSEEVPVQYVRPPIVRTLKSDSDPRKQALLDLRAEVFSPTPLKDDSVQIKVNHRETTANKVEIAPGEKKNLWTIRLRGVPLDAGRREQEIALSLSNAEARCRSPLSLKVQSTEVLTPPEVAFLDPPPLTKVRTARVTIRFQVRSVGKLERVRLLQEGREQPIDPADAPREGGEFVLSVSRQVELRPGPNQLSVEAVSVSGRQPDNPTLIVNYLPPPFRVEIDRLTEGQNGRIVPRIGSDQFGPIFAETASGRVYLHGRIWWADKETTTPNALHVFVNCFQQAPVPIERKANETNTEFTEELLLDRPKGNRVRLIAVGQDADDPVGCTVDCSAPVTEQRLHVLVLSARSGRDVARRQILTAFNYRPAAEGAADRPSSRRNRIDSDHLRGELFAIEREMRRDQQKDKDRGTASNHVLLIYYEGMETISKEGHFFGARDLLSGRADPSGIRCEKLVRDLSNMPGAHILLLDVERGAPAGDDALDRISNWAKDYSETLTHVAVMRCAPRGKAGRPQDVRLLPVLERTIPREGRLSKLVDLVKEALEKSPEAGLLICHSYVPHELAELRVSRPR